jgi:hypothetical protein
MNKIIKAATTTLAMAFVFSACQKMDRPELGDYTRDANPPGGPLKFYVAFDGTTTDPLMNAVDSIRATFPSANPLAPADGINGKAVQGERTKAIRYAAPNDFAKATSMSVAFWMKHSPHAGGAEFVFSMPTSNSDWPSNQFFMLIEDQGQSTAQLAAVKFVVQGQWFEFVGEKRIQGGLLDGNWHHLAVTYDQATSKMSYFLDGQQLTGLDASVTDVKKNGQPRGPLDFTNINGFIIGGTNKHVGISGPGDDWIQSFSGQLDQFRLYDKPLTAAEVQELFNSKM